MQKFLLSMFIMMLLFACKPQTEKATETNNEQFVHYENFESAYIRPRNVDVWLPENYNEQEKYQVLYMHDGQNICDGENNYGGKSWKVNETIENLTKTGKIEPCIVVGIWNTQDRTIEYTPNKPFEMLSDSAKKAYSDQGRITQNPKSDEYLKFIVTELKPFIDQKYATKTEKEHTFIAGSSMGGLISLYALAEYPDVFGGAACISTHWPLSIKQNSFEFASAYMQYLEQNQAAFNHSKVYFDYGTETLDSMYGVHQTEVDSLFGTFSLVGHDYQSGIYKGHAHNEEWWAKRFPAIAEFLLGSY